MFFPTSGISKKRTTSKQILMKGLKGLRYFQKENEGLTNDNAILMEILKNIEEKHVMYITDNVIMYKYIL